MLLPNCALFCSDALWKSSFSSVLNSSVWFVWFRGTTLTLECSFLCCSTLGLNISSCEIKGLSVFLPTTSSFSSLLSPSSNRLVRSLSIRFFR